MDKIDPKYWNKFRDSKLPLRYSGIKFENLVNELLKIMYGVEWVRTKKSHDNNRDFWITLNAKKMWAECKNYNDTIAMDILAPTLVMAQIYNTNIIIFFSRSRINPKAKDKILAYGEKTEKEIIFFDAERLENLILEKRTYLPKKFQPKVLAGNMENISFKASLYFFQNAVNASVISDDEFVDYLSAIKIHYNEIFSLKIIIHNSYSGKKIRAEIYFADENPDRYKFEYLDEQVKHTSSLYTAIDLEPGAGAAKTIHLRPIIYTPYLMLPRFKIKVYDGIQLLNEWKSKDKQLECTWVGQTKLIGKEYQAILDEVTKQLIGNTKLSILLLKGSSGTGKTRMASECSAVFLKFGYKVLNLTSVEDYSSRYLLKEIIYFLYELPKELIINELEKKLKKGKAKEQISSGNIMINMIRKIESFVSENDLCLFIDEYGDILFEKLSVQKYVLMVDNIQFAGKAFQYFIKQYIYYSGNQSRSNYSIFFGILNEDYMTSEASELFFDIIHTSIEHKIIKQMDGFKTTEQGILFLRELIHVSGEQYDELFRDLIERVSLRPYHLYYSIKLLEDENIIKVSPNNQGYIFIGAEYEDSKLKLCQNFTDVLNKRWKFIIAEFEENRIYNIFSTFYFFERINLEIIETFELSKEIIDDLCRRHFLKKDIYGVYEFEHDIIRNYFENEHKKFLLTCFSVIKKEKTEQKEHLLKQYFVPDAIYHITQENDMEYIIKHCIHINEYHIPKRLSEIYYRELFNKCISNKDFFDSIAIWIEVLQNICVNIRKNSGSQNAADFYKRIFDFIISNYETFNELYFYPFRQMMHSYCDILVEMHDREAAERLIQIILEKSSKAEDLDDDSADERNVLRAIMYNRWYVSYNTYELTEEIERKRKNYMDKSLAHTEHIRNYHKRNLIKYLNYSDKGYNYYGYAKDRKKLLEIWDNCLLNMPQAAPEKTLNYYRKLVQYDLINQDYDKMMEHIKLGRDYLENGEYSHEPLIFTTFFTMAEIMGNLQWFPKEKHLYIKKLIEDVIQIQQLLKNGKMGDILLVKGVDAYYAEDVDDVYYSFKNAYKNYEQKKTSRYWIKKELLLENIHRSFTELEIYQKRYDISFLPEPHRTPLADERLKTDKASGIQRTHDNKMNLALLN